MKTTIRISAIAATGALALAACSSAPEETPSASNSSPAAMVDYKACMVSDAGGFDDKSFNQSGYEGLTKAAADLGVEINSAESADGNDYGPNIDAMVADGCDLIITVGFLLGDATETAAAANPDTDFAIIDFAYDDAIANVKPILFNTNEAAFLAGYAAAGTTSGTVATFGGINIPPVTVFMDGFLKGVNYYNGAKGTSVKVLGWDGKDGSFTGDFDNQTTGQTVTQGFLDQGADIIMPVAGPVGLGAAAAIQASGGAWMIGVDQDWTATAPDYKDIIFTSVLKQIGAAVYDVIDASAVGAGFSNEPYFGTLGNGGVGLAAVASALPAEVAAELETIKAGVIDGSIPTS